MFVMSEPWRLIEEARDAPHLCVHGTEVELPVRDPVAHQAPVAVSEEVVHLYIAITRVISTSGRLTEVVSGEERTYHCRARSAVVLLAMLESGQRPEEDLSL